MDFRDRTHKMMVQDDKQQQVRDATATLGSSNVTKDS
jgi:hypothetical protein